MNKLRLIAAVVIAGAFTLLSSGAAQAYPPNDVNVIITAPDSTLVGGKTVHFTVTTDASNLNCAWTVKLPNGVAKGVSDTVTGNGTSFKGSFKTKPVSATEKHALTVTCGYDDNDLVSAPISHSNAVTPAVFVSGGGASTLLAAPQTVSASATVTLLPRGGNGNGNNALPDTGGSNLWIFVLAGVLVVGGGATVLASRARRSTH